MSRTKPDAALAREGEVGREVVAQLGAAGVVLEQVEAAKQGRSSPRWKISVVSRPPSVRNGRAASSWGGGGDGASCDLARGATPTVCGRHTGRQRRLTIGRPSYMHYACIFFSPRSLACAAVARGCWRRAAAAAPPTARDPQQGRLQRRAPPIVVVPRRRRPPPGRRAPDRRARRAEAALAGLRRQARQRPLRVSCVKVLSQSPVAGERRPRGASVAVIEAACHTPTRRRTRCHAGRRMPGPAV